MHNSCEVAARWTTLPQNRKSIQVTPVSVSEAPTSNASPSFVHNHPGPCGQLVGKVAVTMYMNLASWPVAGTAIKVSSEPRKSSREASRLLLLIASSSCCGHLSFSLECSALPLRNPSSQRDGTISTSNMLGPRFQRVGKYTDRCPPIIGSTCELA